MGATEHTSSGLGRGSPGVIRLSILHSTLGRLGGPGLGLVVASELGKVRKVMKLGA